MSAVMGPYWPALAVVMVGLCWAVVGPVAKEEIKHRNVRMVVRVFESKKKNIPMVQIVNITGFKTRPGQRAGYGRVRVRVRKF